VGKGQSGTALPGQPAAGHLQEPYPAGGMVLQVRIPWNSSALSWYQQVGVASKGDGQHHVQSLIWTVSSRKRVVTAKYAGCGSILIGTLICAEGSTAGGHLFQIFPTKAGCMIFTAEICVCKRAGTGKLTSDPQVACKIEGEFEMAC